MFLPGDISCTGQRKSWGRTAAPPEPHSPDHEVTLALVLPSRFQHRHSWCGRMTASFLSRPLLGFWLFTHSALRQAGVFSWLGQSDKLLRWPGGERAGECLGKAPRCPLPTPFLLSLLWGHTLRLHWRLSGPESAFTAGGDHTHQLLRGMGRSEGQLAGHGKGYWHSPLRRDANGMDAQGKAQPWANSLAQAKPGVLGQY